MTINNTFNDMPVEIQYIILNKMQGSDIVKIWYHFPDTHNIIKSHLYNINFKSIEHYILHNLNNYVDLNTRNHLLKFPQRLSYILMFFELGYYNEAINYCTIEDEKQFNNFIKLIKFFPHLQDAFDLVKYNEKEMVENFIELGNNTNLLHQTIYTLSYKLNKNEIINCINMYNSGYNENDIINMCNSKYNENNTVNMCNSEYNKNNNLNICNYEYNENNTVNICNSEYNENNNANMC